MNTLKKYKTEIRRMFFLSVNKDIKIWRENSDSFYSPDYNGVVLKIDTENCNLILVQNRYNEKFIFHYRRGPFITDLKIWWYVRKLKKYSKQQKEDAKIQSDINQVKAGLDVLEKRFVREIRKEKLEKIQS